MAADRLAHAVRAATLGLMLLSACADGSITASGEKLDGPIVVSATIGGRPWVADSGTRGAIVYASGGPGQVYVTGSRRVSGFLEQFQMVVDSFAVGTPIPMRKYGASLSQIITPVDQTQPQFNFFSLDSAGAGSLTVDGYDPVNRLVSGHFAFRARIVVQSDSMGSRFGDSVITVTDGKFRLPYVDRYSP